nr:pentatricopeptide repeat-containing protein At1g11290, chloroplastic [Ipomoea trifida]
MSFQLLATTSTAPAPPLPPSLAPRTHIPAHVYTHPAAILLELCTSVKELRQMLPIVIKNGLYNELLFQTKLTMLEGHFHHSSLDSSFSFYSRMRRTIVDTALLAGKKQRSPRGADVACCRRRKF